MQPPLLRVGGEHRVHGDGGVVVDPDHVLAARVGAVLAHEAAGRRGALVRQHLGQRALADAGHGVVAARQPQQHRRAAAQPRLTVEHHQPRVALVDHGKRPAAVVVGGAHPAEQLARIGCQRAGLGGRLARHEG